MEEPQDANADRGEELRHLAIGRRRRGIEAHRAVRSPRIDALEHQRVDMSVRVQPAAEALHGGDGAAPAIDDAPPARGGASNPSSARVWIASTARQSV